MIIEYSVGNVMTNRFIDVRAVSSKSMKLTFMPKGYLYILECSDEFLYTGSTVDVNRRLNEHQSGRGANFTKQRLPVRLLYVEEYDRIQDAFAREKQVQKWSREKKWALMEGNFERLKSLSECQNSSHFKNKRGGEESL